MAKQKQLERVIAMDHEKKCFVMLYANDFRMTEPKLAAGYTVVGKAQATKEKQTINTYKATVYTVGVRRFAVFAADWSAKELVA